MERYRENPNPPQVRFIRKNGRIIPIFSGKRSGVQPRKAAELVGEQLDLMAIKVDTAEKGHRVHLGYGTDHEVRGFKSSFPAFYSEIGFKNKEDFRNALSKPGLKQERLLERAVSDLKKANDYRFGLPPERATAFKVATRQLYDNSGVIFRRKNGVIHPMRITKAPPHTTYYNPNVMPD